MIARRTNASGEVAPLRIAVPKGALFADCVSMLRAADVEVGALADPGRQLVIRTPGYEFIIGKPTDIPVYVASGAADVGIAGKDVLVESDLDVVELLDLGFGECRFVVAEPEDAHASIEELYRHLGVIRVATKYPRVTEAHFAARGIQIEVVKLNGNIEIAPLIGIAEQVVDITQTGTTLSENKLRIVEDVMDSSARFIANPAALRTDTERVTGLAQRLSAASLQ
ncbi:MAG: ATP phosphoribosyltransferase [Actinobacteria bacterium HGW-Actinobacteria-10]|jgi:ATP phosphoribosyltransferase regulatory subunit|nr:MAG: ATP phosphoribosyltransferase [Actinobacteria bacterium HGW-Actinobacteria-10]